MLMNATKYTMQFKNLSISFPLSCHFKNTQYKYRIGFCLRPSSPQSVLGRATCVLMDTLHCHNISAITDNPKLLLKVSPWQMVLSKGQSFFFLLETVSKIVHFPTCTIVCRRKTKSLVTYLAWNAASVHLPENLHRSKGFFFFLIQNVKIVLTWWKIILNYFLPRPAHN